MPTCLQILWDGKVDTCLLQLLHTLLRIYCLLIPTNNYDNVFNLHGQLCKPCFDHHYGINFIQGP